MSPKISGVFREKQRIEPEYAWSPRHNLEERAFILVGVFNLDPGYAYGIERSWRDLTGARTIYHHLYNEHDLCRILFLERTNKTTDIGKKNLKMRLFDRELALSARGPTSGTYGYGSGDFVTLLDYNDAIASTSSIIILPFSAIRL